MLGRTAGHLGDIAVFAVWLSGENTSWVAPLNIHKPFHYQHPRSLIGVIIVISDVIGILHRPRMWAGQCVLDRPPHPAQNRPAAALFLAIQSPPYRVVTGGGALPLCERVPDCVSLLAALVNVVEYSFSPTPPFLICSKSSSVD